MDLQFSLLLVITGVVFMSHKAQDREYGLAPTLMLLLAELAWDRAGVHAIKRGDTWALYMFWALSLILPVFVVSVAVVSVDNDNTYFDEFRVGQSGSPRTGRLVKIVVLASACVLNRVCTVISSLSLYRNMGTDRYLALIRLFKLGFKKYGRHAAGAAGSSGAENKYNVQDTLNPLAVDVAIEMNLRNVAATQHVPGGAACVPCAVSEVAKQRLAAMYARQAASQDSMQNMSAQVVSTESKGCSNEPTTGSG
jgi:hypothetical protein